MIEFKWDKIDKKSNNPIIKDAEIDELAEMLLQDYKPQLIKEPGQINYLHFLESYLGATVEFRDIYYDEGDKPIWGVTAFNDDDILKTFDRDNMCTENIKLTSRTIVIDNSVMEKGKEGLALFTCLHEGGHLWMHPGVFIKCREQISLFDINEEKQVICCRRESIENFGNKKTLMTAEDFREHQASYFASAIAMPKSTFIPLAKEILKTAGINGGRIVTGIDYDLDLFADREFPQRISDVFGVSKQAASIRLKKLGLIIDKETYRKQNAQKALF